MWRRAHRLDLTEARETEPRRLDFILKAVGSPSQAIGICWSQSDSAVVTAAQGMKQAGVTDLGCKVSCVPVLMTGPHWTHSDSGILTGLPARPCPPLGSPLSPRSSSHALSSVRRHSGVPSSGSVPCPSQTSARPAACFFQVLPKCLLMNAPLPNCWKSPPTTSAASPA